LYYGGAEAKARVGPQGPHSSRRATLENTEVLKLNGTELNFRYAVMRGVGAKNPVAK